MHICLITSGRPTEIFCGGEEKFIRSFGNWLLEQGNDVTIVSRELFGIAAINPKSINLVNASHRPAKAKTLHLPYVMYSFILLMSSLVMTLRIIAMHKKSTLSLLHVQDTGYGGLSGAIAAKILKVPLVISSHGLRYKTLEKTLKGFSKAFLSFEFTVDCFVVKRANLLIVVSQSQKDFFLQIGLKKEKIVVIPIGVQTNEFKTSEEERSSARKELDIRNEILIGFVGRLSTEKNILSLLHSFSNISKQSIDMKMIVVGTGPLEKELKQYCKINKLLDRINFTGVRSDINKLLSAIDIFVLPSYTEGCPTVLLEAMSSGKAIVASNIRSISDIIEDGTECILVNPCHTEELEKAILLLCNNIELRNKLSLFAQEKVKNFDINLIYPKIFGTYQNYIRKNRTK
jgi:glycosyltransferase involved in cell wall biosynthesis